MSRARHTANRLRPASAARLAALAMLLGAPLANAALTLSVAANVDPVRNNEDIYVEFLVGNTDAFDRTGVVLTMPYPAGLNQLFETQFDGDCASTTCNPGETVTWTIGTVPAGSTVSVPLPPRVTSSAADGTLLTFDGTVTDSTTATANASTAVTVRAAPVYDVTLAEDRDPVAPGDVLTFEIDFGMLDTAAAVNDSRLRFALPPGTSFDGASDGGSLVGSDVEWNLGLLGPGEGGTRSVSVVVGAGAVDGGAVGAQAEIFNLAAPAENAVSESVTAVRGSVALDLSIEANVDPARRDEFVYYLLTVSNNDPFPRIGVTLTTWYSPGLNTIFESEFDGDCDGNSCTSGERLIWSVGDVPAGESVTVAVAPRVAGTTNGGQLINFYVTAEDAAGVQQRQSESVRVQTDAIYSLALLDDSDPAGAGGLVNYKLVYAQRDDSAVAGPATLRMPIPAGASFDSATGGGTLSGDAVVWDLGILTPGDSGVRKASLLLDGGLAPGEVIAAEAVLASQNSPLEVARAEADTVIGDDVLLFAIEAHPDPARAADLANLRLTVTNVGAVQRNGIVVEGTYPLLLNQLFETVFDGDCLSTTCNPGERLRFPPFDLAPGQARTLTLPPTLNSNLTGGTLIDFALRATDSSGFQARQADALRVQTDSLFDLAVAAAVDPVAPGATLDYTLAFGLRADAGAAVDSVIVMPVPDNAAFVSASDGGALAGGDVVWPLGILSPGETGVRTARFALDVGAPPGLVVEADAEIFGPAVPGRAVRAEANTVVAAAPPLSLAIESNPDAAQNSELTYHQLVISNHDAITRLGVQPQMMYPRGFNVLFESEFDGQCDGNSCTFGERVLWPAMDIPPGGTYSVDLAPTLSNLAEPGALVNVFASVTDALGAQASGEDALRVQSDTPFDLAIDEDRDALPAGDLLDYKLTYGYREDAGALSDARLRFPIPAGTSFVSATGGGVLVGDAVEWALGVLDPGDGGIRQAVVQVDFAAPNGRVIQASAEVGDAGATTGRARAETTSIVADPVPLTLDIDSVVASVAPNQEILLNLTVTNNDSIARTGIVLQMRYPQGLNQLFESDPDFTGDCGSTTCNPGERVTWPAVDLGPGESIVYALPPQVNSIIQDGTLLRFEGWVTDSLGAQARDFEALFSGCLTAIDNDCDGILDTSDNCLGIPNIPQRDTDGDGIGNFCDADIRVPNDCIVNPLDLGPFKAAFFSGPGDGNWNPDADFNGDGVVNPVDLGILKSQFFQAPGPSGLPNACAP